MHITTKSKASNSMRNQAEKITFEFWRLRSMQVFDHVLFLYITKIYYTQENRYPVHEITVIQGAK